MSLNFPGTNMNVKENLNPFIPDQSKVILRRSFSTNKSLFKGQIKSSQLEQIYVCFMGAIFFKKTFFKREIKKM